MKIPKTRTLIIMVVVAALAAIGGTMVLRTKKELPKVNLRPRKRVVRRIKIDIEKGFLSGVADKKKGRGAESAGETKSALDKTTENRHREGPKKAPVPAVSKKTKETVRSKKPNITLHYLHGDTTVSVNADKPHKVVDTPHGTKKNKHGKPRYYFTGDAVVSGKVVKPWVVHVASYLSKTSAQKLLWKVRAHGYKAYMTEFRDGKRLWYRVRVGFYSSREEAIKVSKTISGRFKISDNWVLRAPDTEVKRVLR